mgnify:CR=1 FL=1
MPQPLISVVIPCYNAEAFVEEAIESVFAQSIQDFELILVDDGSTDKTGDCIERIAQNDKRVRVCRLIHQGGNVARNVGLSFATGKWIQFLDADDVLHPQAWEHHLNRLKDNQSSMSFASEIGFQNEDSLSHAKNLAHERLFSAIQQNTYEKLFEYLRDKWHMCSLNGALLNRELCCAVNGFDVQIQRAQEGSLLWRMAVKAYQSGHFNVVAHKTPVLFKRLHEQSLSHTYQKGERKCAYQAPMVRRMLALLQFVEAFHIDLPEEVKTWILNSLYLHSVHAFRNGLAAEAYLGLTHWKSHKPWLPRFGPGYHYFLHSCLGFMAAEKILALMRLIFKGKFISNN